MTIVEPATTAARMAAMILLAFPIVIDTALKGALLLGLCAVTSRVLRRKSASVRHMVWAAGITGHLILPLCTWYAPPLYWQILPPPPWLAVSQRIAAQSGATPYDAASVVLVAWAAIWIAGIVVGLTRLTVSQGRGARLGATARTSSSDALPALVQSLSDRLGNHRAIRVRHHPSVSIPMTSGLLSPVILMPGDAETWPPTQCEAFVAHEIEHVRRYDTVTQLAADLVLVLFWFDPLLWIAARRMRVERELASDDAVLRLGIAPWMYANDLLSLARRLSDTRRGIHSSAIAAIAGSGPLEIESRLRAILDPSTDRRRSHRAALVLALVILALLEIPLGALRPFRWP